MMQIVSNLFSWTDKNKPGAPVVVPAHIRQQLSQQTEELHRLSSNNGYLRNIIQQLEGEKKDMLAKFSKLQNENHELRSQ